ncbi:MAG TPA: SIMPL domain-containing protein [Polyangiales bacterium]|nr:SIMPL domain-containing protein [Polyangiales bacterium]
MHSSFVFRTFCATLALCCLSACAHGRSFTMATTERGIGATGTGKATAAPDIARTSIGVEVRGADVQAAVADATARMTAVTGAIKALGIADKDLRTHSFSVGFEQEPSPPPPQPMPQQRGAATATAEPAPAGPRGYYRVSNTLEVTIRDLGSVGKVLQAATAAGANNIWGINFELENTEPLKVQARAQAVERAKQSATELAQLSGVKLGKLLAINEGDGQGQPGGPVYMSMRAANADVPIERGEIAVSYSVRVLYDVREHDDH